ncbi:hypothetical protein [Campylobacter geochelonis]
MKELDIEIIRKFVGKIIMFKVEKVDSRRTQLYLDNL